MQLILVILYKLQNVDHAGYWQETQTRGIYLLWREEDPHNSNAIEYVLLSTTGKCIDFGDLLRWHSGVHCVGYSNAVRGVIHSAYHILASPNFMNIIQYITMSTLGNATDFGDALTGGNWMWWSITVLVVLLVVANLLMLQQ